MSFVNLKQGFLSYSFSDKNKLLIHIMLDFTISVSHFHFSLSHQNKVLDNGGG